MFFHTLCSLVCIPVGLNVYFLLFPPDMALLSCIPGVVYYLFGVFHPIRLCTCIPGVGELILTPALLMYASPWCLILFNVPSYYFHPIWLCFGIPGVVDFHYIGRWCFSHPIHILYIITIFSCHFYHFFLTMCFSQFPDHFAAQVTVTSASTEPSS